MNFCDACKKKVLTDELYRLKPEYRKGGYEFICPKCYGVTKAVCVLAVIVISKGQVKDIDIGERVKNNMEVIL